MLHLLRYFLLTLFVIIAAPSWAAKAPCDKALSNTPSDAKASEQDELQKEISAKELQIRELATEYHKLLGPYSNPFALVFTTDEGNRLYQKMLTRKEDGRNVRSPLDMVSISLKKTYVEKTPLDWKLLNYVVDDAKKLLAKHPPASITNTVILQNLQSELYALNQSIEYLRRFRVNEVVDRDGEKVEKEEEKKPEEKKKEKKEKKEKKKTPPKYPELPEEYDPHTKDTDKGGDGESEEEHRLIEANFSTPYWGYVRFSNIKRHGENRFRQTKLMDTPLPPPRYKHTGKEMIVNTFGKTSVKMFLPPLHRPLQPEDPRATISRTETGGYVLNISDPSITSVKIPVIKNSGIAFINPMDKESLVEEVGVKKEEWPADIQAAIFRKYSEADGKTKPLEVAQAISDFISKEYLYSVDKRPERDPIDAMKAGAFQCDMAALIMVAILRDVYKIPSEAIGGFRGKQFRGGADKKSYLVVPAEGHAWIEVFHNGEWHMFDPTPIKKDRKTKNDGEKSEYSDIKLDNTLDPENEDSDSDEMQEGEGTGDSNLDELHKRLKESQKKHAKEGKKTHDKDKKEGKGKDKNKDKKESDQDGSGEDGGMSLDDLVKQLEVGSIEMGPNNKGRNPLRDRALRTLFKLTVDPNKYGLEIQNRLNQLARIIKAYGSDQMTALFQDALSAHANNHPGIVDWLDQISILMPKQEVNKSFQELYKATLAVSIYASLLDKDGSKGSVAVPKKLLSLLAKAQEELRKLSHADAADIGLVQELIKELPPVARQLLRKDYDFSELGPNAPTRNIAKDLKNQKLNDLRLLSILGPHTDFILNATPRPEYAPLRTWQRQYGKTGKDILPLERFSDLGRSFMGQPGKSLEENMQEGTAFMKAHRRRVFIPKNKGTAEAERITIVLYDTSKSMAGEPGRFQAGLIGAFTAKALSDISPTGRHRHKVLIIPFDDNPGEATRVTNTQEALNVIRNYQEQLKNTGGGTNIQAALIQAMAIIAEAEKRSGEPLAAANIVLMTDGQAQINVPELVQARNAIDRDTPLQVMFAAINQTSEELKEFANNSRGVWAEGGYYREFTSQDISEVLQESDSPPKIKKSHFYSDKRGQEIPTPVYRLMDQAINEARDLQTQISYANTYTSARDHLTQFERVKWNFVEHKERQLEMWIIKLRQFLEDNAFKNPRVKEKIIDDIMINFEKITGVEFNDLSDHEQGHLGNMLRQASGVAEKAVSSK